MSKLFKSKFLLGVMVVAVLAVAGVAVSASPKQASADCMIMTTLRVGSAGVEVQCLQSKVGTVADGKFGPMTLAATKAWQAAHGLVADGIVGPLTRQALNAVGAISGNFPAGCTSAVGYSPTTGVKCDSGPSTGLPAGCSSTAGYSVTTGKKCDSTTTPPSDDDNDGPLQGGAGDITIDDSSAFSNEDVEEGEDDAEVLEFKVEADDESDVEITSVKVEFVNASGSPDSPDFDDYADSVSVWFGGEKVGEADVEDFNESSDVWSKSIALDGAIVRAGDEEKFVVAVSALSNIDSEDMDNADWSADVVSVRFEDAEGVVTTTSEDIDADELEQDFDFVAEGDGEALNLKSSSNDPDASTLLVEENDESDEYAVFAFKVEAEESDVALEDVVLTVTTTGANYEDVVSDVWLEIDGEEFDDVDVVDEATTTADLTFDIDQDFTIDADETVEVTVMMTFREQDGNYDDVGAETVQVMTVSVSGEGADDLSDTATVNGEVHTLSTSAAEITSVSWSKSESDTVGTLDFFFTVTAEDDDFDVLGADIMDDTSGGTFDAPAGCGVTDVCSDSGDGELTRVSGDDVVEDPGVGFTVAEGDTVRFRVRYTATTAGSHEVVMESVAGQEVDEDDQLSPTVTID